MQNIGPLIKSVRTNLGYTQEDIAHRAGVSLPTLIGCEMGRGSITSMMYILQALDYKLAWAGYDDGYAASLIARRKSRGLSPRGLARAIGVSQPMVVSLEKNFKGRVANLEKVLHQLRLVPRLVKSDDMGEANGAARLLPDDVADLLDAKIGQDEVNEPRFIIGDAAQALKSFPSNIVDMVLTSPPYYRLREYDGGGIGNEQTLNDFIANMLIVTKELHRVLTPTGSFWLNIGDSYIDKHQQGVPWRLAIKMMDEQGWILRNSNIWYKKKAGMDSPSDRLPNRHEMIFHFVKQTDYYYNADAIRLTPKKPRLRDGVQVTATGISQQTYIDQITSSAHLTDGEQTNWSYPILMERLSLFVFISASNLMGDL